MRYAILYGTIVGPIWQPGHVCSKHVAARIERRGEPGYHDAGLTTHVTLRDAMLHLLRDGDFQACGFVRGATWLEVVEEEWPSSRTATRRTRVREIAFACDATDDMAAEEQWLDEWDQGGDDA